MLADAQDFLHRAAPRDRIPMKPDLTIRRDVD